MDETLGLLLAGVAAGALNAVGGGGTFVALPALVASGIAPVTANAASTVALLPGALGAAWAYRRELLPVNAVSTWALTGVSMVGGGLGAGLLLVLPAESFDAAVPWLLAFATVVLAFGRRIGSLLAVAAGSQVRLGAGTVLAVQFVLALYGGYFGGAVGILMLAFWSAGLGIDAAMGNPMRVTQVAGVYTIAAGVFLAAADVLGHPRPVALLLVGAMLGGLAGAGLVRRLPSALLRGVVLATAVTMTVLFFLR